MTPQQEKDLRELAKEIKFPVEYMHENGILMDKRPQTLCIIKLQPAKTLLEAEQKQQLLGEYLAECINKLNPNK